MLRSPRRIFIRKKRPSGAGLAITFLAGLTLLMGTASLVAQAPAQTVQTASAR